MGSLRDASKVLFATRGNNATFEEINTGSLQRIADGVELMATNYRQLQQEAEHYRQAARSGLAEIDRIKRQNAALRGVITKLRKQALAAKEER